MVLKPEENILQQELDRFATEVTESNLVINDKKSFVMVCNPSKKYDFPPEFKVGNSKILVKESLKENMDAEEDEENRAGRANHLQFLES